MTELDYFLDTSFLLPFIGIQIAVSDFQTNAIKLLRSALKGGVSTVSLTECWFLTRKAIRNGASSQLESNYIQTNEMLAKSGSLIAISPVNEDITKVQTQIFQIGHTDYFDQIILATAIIMSKKLITMDSQFKPIVNNLSKVHPDLFSEFEGVYSWSQFLIDIKIT